MKNKKTAKSNKFATFLVVLAILGSGVWAVYWFGYKNVTTARPQTNVSTQRLPFDLTGVMDVEQVRQSATLQTVARMRSLQLEKTKGQLAYVIGLSDGSIVELDARTGKRLETNELPKNLPDTESGLPPNFTVAVSFDQARGTAQQQFPDGSIMRMALTNSSGKVIIHAVFTDNASVDIDAMTDHVVHVQRAA